MTMFAVGDVVVCVDDSPNHGIDLRPAIRVGRVYRVIGMTDWFGQVGVRVSGVPLPTSVDWLRAERFRKIQKADDRFIERVKACRPRHRERIEAHRAETTEIGSVHESRVSAGNLAHPPVIQEQ